MLCRRGIYARKDAFLHSRLAQFPPLVHYSLVSTYSVYTIVQCAVICMQYRAAVKLTASN